MDTSADDIDEAIIRLTPMEVIQHTVPPEQDEQRLDRLLGTLWPVFSRTHWQDVITQGGVQINSQICRKPAQRLRLGQVLRVEWREPVSAQAFVPQAMPLEVVYEDTHLRVIHKPAGLVVHPGAGNWQGTLLNGLLALEPAVAVLPRAGIVHRLDKNTSGLLVVARTRACMQALIEAMTNRQIHRHYLAITEGLWTKPIGVGGEGAKPSRASLGMEERKIIEQVIEGAIGRDPRHPLRMAVLGSGGHHPHAKPARTDVTLLKRGKEHSLLWCTLHTGRTHQIRVHCQHQGFPVLGDRLYGARPSSILSRQALHAAYLAFVHPLTGEAMAWYAPLPLDMVNALHQLGLNEVDASVIRRLPLAQSLAIQTLLPTCTQEGSHS